MKRSEMEKLISDTIDANSQETNDELATIILYELEEAGMIPPERVRYTDLENGRTICSPECSWEDE